MPRLTVAASIDDGSPDQLFPLIERFEDYPAIAENVRAATVAEREGDTLVSRWEVNFRKGVLRWEERDRIDRGNHRIDFSQTEGDLARFEGAWMVNESNGGARVEFTAEFDLGIPSLASMLDPVAARTLESNVRELIEAFARAAGTRRPSFDTDDGQVATSG